MNSTTDSEYQPLPRSKRVLSHFLAREMLYDFMTGRLDSDRTTAMQELLKKNSELENELRAMRAAEAYLDVLSKTKITRNHLENLSGVRSKLGTYLIQFRFNNWPDIVKWTSEALLISFAIAILGLFVPWQKIGGQLSDKVGPHIVSLFTLDYMKTSKDLPKTEVKSVQAELVQNEEDLRDTKIETVDSSAKDSSTAKAIVETGESTANQGKTQDSKSEIDHSETKPEETKRESNMNGFVYSMMMSLNDALELTPEIREKIQGYGGIKAGQVELGWRKTNPPGSYFHFSMPEGNYDQLTQTLGQYGRVRIYKNPHERVMPEGQIRIILWIEDNMVNTQDEEKPPQ